MRYTLEIPVEIPSANAVMRWLKHPKLKHRYGKLRRDFGWAVKVEGFGVPKATGRRRIRVTRILGPRQRAFDDDNLRAGAKPLVDELVAFGLLVDDKPKWVGAEYAQERGAAPAARVEIWDETEVA